MQTFRNMTKETTICQKTRKRRLW